MLRNLANHLSQFIPLLLTFVLAAASYWYAMQSELDLFRFSGTKDPTVSDYYMRNFSVQSHDLTQNRFSLVRSSHAEHIPQGNVWNIDQPEVEQYGAKGTAIQGESEQGEYLLDTDQIILKKNVQVHALRQGQTSVLKAEELTLDNRKNTVHTKTPVTVTRATQVMQMKGVEYNNNTGEMRSLGPVKLQIEGKR